MGAQWIHAENKAKNGILNLKLFYRVGEIFLDKSDLFPNAVSAKQKYSEVLIGQYTEHVLQFAHVEREFI